MLARYGVRTWRSDLWIESLDADSAGDVGYWDRKWGLGPLKNCEKFVENVGLDGCGISICSGDNPADCRLIADCGSWYAVEAFKVVGYKAFNWRW